jgi:hypothetical protein
MGGFTLVDVLAIYIVKLVLSMVDQLYIYSGKTVVGPALAEHHQIFGTTIIPQEQLL